MEDILHVYTRPHDPEMPLVCLDEAFKQLVSETRSPLPMKEGYPQRVDYEYERNGTANLFMLFAPLQGWRHTEVTDRRTAVDYAYVLKDLSDTHFPRAKKIVLVQDNLSTHTKASLYQAFPPAEARRLAERFEWHYTDTGTICYRLVRDARRRSVTDISPIPGGLGLAPKKTGHDLSRRRCLQP
jgi:DDE superfamily endonuclease